MKKFFIWYIIIFAFILGFLFFIKNAFYGSFFKNVSKISAVTIYGKENIVDKSEKKVIKPKDVGSINENYANNYKNVDEKYNYKKIKVDSNDIQEVQVYFGAGHYGDNVYYYSNDSEKIKYINELLCSDTIFARK